MARKSFVVPALIALVSATGCQTNQAGNTIKSAGESVAGAADGALKGAVSLVNVDLSNVLNKVALDLKIDKSNVPINAQIPIDVAANVCGISINILSISSGGSPNCTANSTSPALEQAVQQQLAANGSVGGGSQATAPTAPRTTAPSTTGSTGGTTAPSATAPSTTTAPAGATWKPARRQLLGFVFDKFGTFGDWRA